eukprot:1896974-Amphidinium_carterae.1
MACGGRTEGAPRRNWCSASLQGRGCGPVGIGRQGLCGGCSMRPPWPEPEVPSGRHGGRAG